MSGTRRSNKRKASVELPRDDPEQVAPNKQNQSPQPECNISSSLGAYATSRILRKKRTTRATAPSVYCIAPAPITPISLSSLQVADQPVSVEPMTSFSATPISTSSPSYSFPTSSIEEWRTFLQTNGYVFLHDVLPRELVLEVRNLLLVTLESRGLIHPQPTHNQQQQQHDGIASSSSHKALESLPAKAIDTKASPNFLTDMQLQKTPLVQQLLEHPRLSHLIHQLIEPNTSRKATSDGELLSSHLWTSSYKWLRGVGQGCCTGFHLDRVYMSSRAKHDGENVHKHAQPAPLYSCWLPIGDISQEQGCLVISPESHVNAQFERLRTEYGSSNVGTNNGTTSGWIQIKEFTDKPVNWVSSSAPAGSIVLLDLSVLHGTSVNTSNEYRLSCDTRWTTGPCNHQGSDASVDASDSTRRCCGTECDEEPPATIRFKRVDY